MFDNVVVVVLCVSASLLLFWYFVMRKHSYDGKIVITVTEEGVKNFLLELDGDPERLEEQKSVTFKIVSTNTLVEK
jgi:hypothetical protein